MTGPRVVHAKVRSQVVVPLRFIDGFATTARVYAYDDLVDGREHLALGLGDRLAPARSGRPASEPLVRPHSECLCCGRFRCAGRPGVLAAGRAQFCRDVPRSRSTQ
jgi:GTP cyclohydrolase II